MNETTPSNIALITGAAKRLGREIALRLAREGWDICLHYHRSRDEALALAREIEALGRRAVCVSKNLERSSEAAELVGACTEAIGAPSCLINSAAVFEYDRIEDFTEAALDHHWAINLRAPLILAREFAKHLPAHGNHSTPGCIVNLLDQKVAALNADFFTYTVSKLGLAESTRLLALALAPRVRVNAVAPGVALPSKHQSDANFDAAQRMAPLGYGATPADIAQAVSYLVHARAVTGETIIVDGGQYLNPTTRDVMFVAARDGAK